MLFGMRKNEETWLIAGLGNPGREYESTRHNTGFHALEICAREFGIALSRKRFQALTGEGRLGGRKIVLMKPQTFMNLSGSAIAEAASFYKLPAARVIVLCDDVNLDAGVMRIRESGSAGGQNGLKDIISKLGSDAFPRVRIGVGKKQHAEQPLADWVLSSPGEEDRKKIESRYPDAAAAVKLIVDGELQLAQSRYNG